MGTFGPPSLRANSFAVTDPREDDMRTACFPRGRVILIYLFIGSHLPMIGCSDDSKTTGTMVEESDEIKARRAAKRGSTRGGPPKAKRRSQARRSSRRGGVNPVPAQAFRPLFELSRTFRLTDRGGCDVIRVLLGGRISFRESFP